MKNTEWNTKKIKKEIDVLIKELNSYIHCSIDDEIFTRFQKIYMNSYEALVDNYGELYLSCDVFPEEMIMASNLLNASNRAKDRSEFHDIMENENLRFTFKARNVFYLFTNKYIDQMLNGTYPTFYLSLNKHLTIEQAHSLLNSFYNSLLTYPKNNFMADNLLTLIVMYSRFYNQKETHKDFYELLTSAMEIFFPLYKEWKVKRELSSKEGGLK